MSLAPVEKPSHLGSVSRTCGQSPDTKLKTIESDLEEHKS
jgi:hypothetical protein